MMRVYAKLDLIPMEKKVGPANMQRARELLVERVKSDCQGLLPYRTGQMYKNVDIDDHSITWNETYASYVYNMPQSVNWTRGGPTDPHSRWFDAADERHHDEWIDYTVGNLLGETR